MDNTGTTGSVPIGGSITGRLDPRGDIDWVAVPVVVGRRYRFDIEGVDTGQGTLRDPELLGVYDADGDLLGVRYQGDGGTTNDDGGDRPQQPVGVLGCPGRNSLPGHRRQG